MKAKKYFILLIGIIFCLSGFSQNDSLSVVSKKEITNFHKSIFDLSVDTTIDSTASYKLRYISSNGWSKGPNNPNPKKKYRSKSFLASDTKSVSIAEIVRFPESTKDTLPGLSSLDSLFLDQFPAKVKKEPVVPFLSDYVVYSSQDDFYRKLKNKSFDSQWPKVVVPLGGKYLLVAEKIEYIGNTSWGTVQFLYYEKII